MRCKACDKIMSDYELTRKFSDSGQFVDLCSYCSSFIKDDDLLMEGNMDLAHLSDLEDEKYGESEGLSDWSTGSLGSLADDDLFD